MPIRVGAVCYLNSRPLVYGLERWPDRFEVRYDVPSRCATLLHAGEIDLGLIPSIEYLGGDYRIVPDIAVASDGEVASVALFARVSLERVRSIALDTSSRTSVALLRVLCERQFSIRPELVAHEPDLDAMLQRHDAALLIGDRALFADAAAAGVEKIDLGQQWRALTGLPFVYAFWAGRDGVAGATDVESLQAVRDRGAAAAGEIARAFFPDDPPRQAVGTRYLREHVRFSMGLRERAGLERFLRLAHEVGAAPPPHPLRFYDAP